MMKKFSKICSVCMLMLFSIFLTGCWDYGDINKKNIVISIGIDRIGDMLEVTGEVAKLFSKLEAKEKTNVTSVYTDLSYGKTFEEFRVDFSSKRPYETFLGATRVVVFGKEYAREGIEPYINRINKTYDYRKTLFAFVSREPPRQLLNTDIENDLSVGFFLEDNINFLRDRGIAVSKDIGEILSDIAMGDVGYMLPYVGIEQKNVRYLGLAVMKDSKLVDIIDIKDTSGILYLKGKNINRQETINSPKNPKNKLSFDTKINKRDIKVKYKDKKIVINIDLDLNAELSYQYYLEPLSDKELKEFEYLVSEKIKKDVELSVKRSQDCKCDMFGFARYFRADDPQNYKKINWRENYDKADVIVSVKTKITNTNLSDYKVKYKY
ncbi:Ger(x)C family spore germination protein [Clostridium sp. MB40-C1]|uniref:Ger(x)C family spore germination protein n=1 Tax=Clostridium sp. MB40-C1 TaxID=3070996 RepID=UPI0027E003FC|nr:Ger(x)C family spore germination protein [Clostridium sp. MB40-C1]WMJ79188.1 Ger(x)C family spore germination protein [Clostridium sp. MB40-C1]